MGEYQARYSKEFLYFITVSLSLPPNA